MCGSKDRRRTTIILEYNELHVLVVQLKGQPLLTSYLRGNLINYHRYFYIPWEEPDMAQSSIWTVETRNKTLIEQVLETGVFASPMRQLKLCPSSACQVPSVW